VDSRREGGRRPVRSRSELWVVKKRGGRLRHFRWKCRSCRRCHLTHSLSSWKVGIEVERAVPTIKRFRGPTDSTQVRYPKQETTGCRSRGIYMQSRGMSKLDRLAVKQNRKKGTKKKTGCNKLLQCDGGKRWAGSISQWLLPVGRKGKATSRRKVRVVVSVNGSRRFVRQTRATTADRPLPF
jgi:hypothetical protein